MPRIDQEFENDDGPLLDQYAIAMGKYKEVKDHIFHLRDTIPPVDGNHEELARFREEVLRVSSVVIPGVRAELQAIDPFNLSEDQKKVWNNALHDLEEMGGQLYNLLRSLPK